MKKYLFLPLYGNMEIRLWQRAPPGSISHSEKAKGQLHFVFSVVQHFTERFKQKESMLTTSAITAVTSLASQTLLRAGAYWMR